MNARDVMTVEPSVVTPDTTIRQAAAIMQARGVCLLPVVESEPSRRLKGVISDRDIVERCVAPGHDGHCLVSDHWTAQRVETIRLDDSLDAVITRLATANIRRAPVIDAFDRVVGILTRADLVRRGSRGDPELRARLLEQLSEVTA